MIKKFWNTLSGQKRSLLFIVVAVLIAGFVTVWVNDMIKGKASGRTSKVETVPIAVAAVDVNWGSVLTKEQVKTLPYLKDNLPAGYFTDPAALAGRTIIFPVKANEPILASRLAPMDFKGGGVAAVVSANKRAMAVKVDKVIGVSGFVHPGNRVDILVTLREQGDNDKPIAKTVLENILVLATGPEMEVAKKEKAEPVDVITLEVSPEDGEKLALAAAEGKLQLTLRNFTDTLDVHTRGTTVPVLLASYSGAAALAPRPSLKTAAVHTPRRVAAVSSDSPVVTVEVIHGKDVEQFRFGKGE